MHIIVLLIVIYLAIKFIFWCAGILYSTRSVARTPTTPAETKWWFMLNDEVRGPVDKTTLQQLFVDAALPRATLVRDESSSDWISADSLPEFTSQIAEAVAASNNSISESISDLELRKKVEDQLNHCDTLDEKRQVLLDQIAETCVRDHGSRPSQIKSDMGTDQPPVHRVVPLTALTASQSVKAKPHS